MRWKTDFFLRGLAPLSHPFLHVQISVMDEQAFNSFP